MSKRQKDVKPFVRMTEVPAKQIGWMGISSNTLEFEDEGIVANSDGYRYAIIDENLKKISMQLIIDIENENVADKVVRFLKSLKKEGVKIKQQATTKNHKPNTQTSILKKIGKM